MDKGEIALELVVLLAGAVAQDPAIAEGLLRTVDRIRELPDATQSQHHAITLLETIIHQAHSR